MTLMAHSLHIVLPTPSSSTAMKMECGGSAVSSGDVFDHSGNHIATLSREQKASSSANRICSTETTHSTLFPFTPAKVNTLPLPIFFPGSRLARAAPRLLIRAHRGRAAMCGAEETSERNRESDANQLLPLNRPPEDRDCELDRRQTHRTQNTHISSPNRHTGGSKQSFTLHLFIFLTLHRI